jgi:hypothetical protein
MFELNGVHKQVRNSFCGRSPISSDIDVIKASAVSVQPIRQVAILPVTARRFTGLRLSIRIFFML